jgi:uncharacterized protein YkwD
MATNNFTSHTGSDGSDARQRMLDAGYSWNYWGENINWYYSSVQAVVDRWISSDAHCANIMNPRFKDVGLACVRGTSSSTYAYYWTMNLGEPR